MNYKIDVYHSLTIFFFCLLMISCVGKKSDKKEKSAPSTTERSFGLTMEFEAQIDSLVSELSWEEKVKLLHGNSFFTTAGVERLGIPELKMTDGPLGIREELERDSWNALGRKDDFATYFPAGAGLSATWDPEMALRFGDALGREARARGKDIVLAPAINIIRTPIGGRTYEYFTEDPYLNKKLSVPFIKGVQSNDIGVSVKHFALNNQETLRDSIDVIVDERTLREIYLPAFKAAVVEAGAYSVMAAYNKFRGDYLWENNYLLDDILRKEWGFKGVVISDWGAVKRTVKPLRNGLDIEMGTPRPFNQYFFADPLVAAVKSGEVGEKELDIHVRRVLRVMFTVKSMGDKENRKKGELVTKRNYRDAYKIATESIVLLKNEQRTLPLNLEGIKKIAIIGENAKIKNALGGNGAGVKTKEEITPYEGLANQLDDKVELLYAKGYTERYQKRDKMGVEENTVDAALPVNHLDPHLVDEAIETVKKGDLTLLFIGSTRDYETEASDRLDMKLPFGQVELINKILKEDPNTILIMTAGAPYELTDFDQKVKAIVWNWFNGSEGGRALADVLLGKVNPSGKLPWTLPKKLEDSPAHATHNFPGQSQVEYGEGLLVGYRWFDTKRIEPLYPFGFGLSYTSFELFDAKVDKSRSYSEKDTIGITLKVKNIGGKVGKEVVQVYTSKKDSKVERVAKELKAFQKVKVEPNEVKEIKLELPVKELAYYDEENKDWKVEKGEYTLMIGNSSRNISQKIKISVL